MSNDEHEQFQRRYLTIPELFQQYRREDRPLNREMILSTLMPLAGSSFLRRATEGLAERLTETNELHALDLYQVFLGDVAHCEDSTHQEEAAMCLYHLSGSSVPLDYVYTMACMEADELMVREYRSDRLYFDDTRTQWAGDHMAAQWRFYKGGLHLHTISFSMIRYRDGQNPFHYLSALADGIFPHRAFSDVKRPALPFVDPRQSSFRHSDSLLFISPRFSFDAALPKPKPS